MNVFVLREDLNFVLELLAVLKANGEKNQCLTEPWNRYFSLAQSKVQ